MKQYKDAFSKITNQLFYVKVGEDENGKGQYSHEESILYKCNYDDKVILILHELFLNTTLKRECLITLDYLILTCGYKADKDNRKSFKNILKRLKDIELINFNEINKSNELIVIDTDGLMMLIGDGNYTILAGEELGILNSVTDVRKRTTLLKLYLYLKARTTKRTNDEDINLNCTPQITYQAYETINKYTNISESRIKEYIDELQEMKLITYRNVGKRYKETDKHQKLNEAPNVYAINNLQDDIEAELELGIKQCKHDQQSKGYVVVDKEYKNNNREIFGKKGSLTKKINNGTITEEEQKQYDDICTMQNKYKEEYNNFEVKNKQEEKPKKKGISKQLEYRRDISYQEEDYWGISNSFDRGRQLAKEGINPFTNQPYDHKKYETDTSYEDYIDSLL